MNKLIFSPTFKKSFNKRIKYNEIIKKRFEEKLRIFALDRNDTRLKTHKLSGKLSELWSFSVDYDCRVIFYFDSEGNTVLQDIGTHEEVY